MPNKTAIEWTDYTSNPIAPVGGGWGCSKVSPGCTNCYAERMNKRMGNKRDFEGKWKFMLKHKELDGLRRLNGTVDPGATFQVFLGDMTDIFHSDVPFEMLRELFAVLDQCDRLTLQVLTKRPGRMAHFANVVLGGYWPSNVWAGTSVELEWDGNRHIAARLDLLTQVPARVRFVSYEPALGPVDFGPWLWPTTFGCPSCIEHEDGVSPHPCMQHDGDDDRSLIHWVIAGGESGPGARPPHPDWFRSVRDQCQAAGVPFFFKQWGEWIHYQQIQVGNQMEIYNASHRTIRERWKGGLVCRLGKKAAGALLDGREWREFPVQE